MVKVKLFFDDGTESQYPHEIDEDDLVKEMSKPKEKRLYTYGIEFSAVERAEVITDAS